MQSAAKTDAAEEAAARAQAERDAALHRVRELERMAAEAVAARAQERRARSRAGARSPR